MIITRLSLSDKHPEISKFWHPSKNGILLPENVTSTSKTKVWWLCDKGHEYETQIRCRVRSGCSRCKSVTDSNRLSLLYPEISKRWHPSKNEKLTPEGISFSSSVKVWWICVEGHEVRASVNSKIQNNDRYGCSFCANKKVSNTNSLAKRNPELLKHWNYQKNSINPEHTLPSSHKDAWWICDLGHDYVQQISLKVRGGLNCPYCSGKKVCESNCLAFVHPDIAKNWHPTKNIISPTQVTRSSNKKVWWLCAKGHEYQDSINHQTSGRECPFCSHHKLLKENSLGHNSPELVKEWDFLKNQIGPEDFFWKSNKKVWWVCEKKHSWEATINNRVSLRQDCPQCIVYKTQEKVRYLFNTILGKEFKKSKPSWLINPKTNRKLELDGYNEELKLAFEYDGEFHFDKVIYQKGITDNRGQKYRDAVKDVLCPRYGVTLIRIPYTEKNGLEEYIQDQLSTWRRVMLNNEDFLISFNNLKNGKEIAEKKYIDLMQRASDLYYTSEAPLVSDDEFDFLKKKFLKDYGYNPIPVGTPEKLSKGFKKVAHNIPMGSLIEFDTTVDVNESIQKWADKYSLEDEFCTSEKLDGLSCSVKFEAGVFTQAVTRGDGSFGDDITENVRKMKNIPAILPLPITGYFRGEIALLKSSCAQHFPKFANERNGAVGLTKRLDGEGCEHLDVFFYKLYTKDHAFSTEFEILDFLKNTLKLTTPRYYKSSLATLIGLHRKYEEGVREKLDYLLDGLVANINSIERQSQILENELLPEYARKYKFESERAITELLAVRPQVGRTGAITPLAILEPVVCGGTLISKATLHNYDEIERLGVEAGDIITLVRSKDVIPKIIGVSSKNYYSTKIEIPKECPVCASKLEKEKAILYCKNDFCSARVSMALIHWLNVLNIKNMGEKIVDALIDADKLKTVADFYRLTVEDIASLDRQGVKNATKIIGEINDKKVITIPELLAGLNIRNLSIKRAEILEDNFTTLDAILKVGTQDLVAIEGIEATLATFIVSGLRAKTKLIEELLTLIKLKPKASGKLTGQSFCFSGFRNINLEKEIQRLGGSIASGVNRKLTYLIVENKNGTTSKIVKAKEYGINVINPDELTGLLSNVLF